MPNQRRFSVNPITLEEFEIPSTTDDIYRVGDFLERHKDKRVVVVQGLGFVGAVMSLVCANAITEEYAVIGIDLPTEGALWKIEAINKGFFPLVADDPKIGDFFECAKSKGNFLATYDPAAYQYADVIVVDVNLDVKKESTESHSLKQFNVELAGFEAAIESIGSYCKEDVLVLVETTVPPGTCQKVIKPILDSGLRKRGASTSKYRLGHSYERVMPGPKYIDSIREFPRVYSGVDDASANAVEKFLSTIIDTRKCALTRLPNTNATEIAKVLENSYRAMNIAFAVEWSRFAEEAGVNLYEIVNAIRARDTHANLMYPGIGVGGYCLTKDPLLASWARKMHFGASSNLSLSVEGVSINDQMPVYAFNRLSEVFGNVTDCKVVFLGVSYRGDVGDTRFTPVKVLLEKVEASGAVVMLHDPFVSYWEELDRPVENSLIEVLSDNADLVIVASGHSEYKLNSTIEVLKEMKPLFIFDTIGLFNSEQLAELGTKHKVSVLGRGDIS